MTSFTSPLSDTKHLLFKSRGFCIGVGFHSSGTHLLRGMFDNSYILSSLSSVSCEIAVEKRGALNCVVTD